METNFTYWGTFLKKLRQFELSVLKILSVYYFLCGLYPWIMLLVSTSFSTWMNLGLCNLGTFNVGFWVTSSCRLVTNILEEDQTCDLCI